CNACRVTIVLPGNFSNALDQGGVGWGKRGAVESHVVFEAGPAVAAELKRPAVERDLVSANAGAGPGAIRCKPLQGGDIEFEYAAVDRHGVLHAHHELNMQGTSDLAGPLQVEGLYLRLHAVFLHLGSQPIDQFGTVLVDAGREIARPGGKRAHVRLERYHAP